MNIPGKLGVRAFLWKVKVVSIAAPLGAARRGFNSIPKHLRRFVHILERCTRCESRPVNLKRFVSDPRLLGGNFLRHLAGGASIRG